MRILVTGGAGFIGSHFCQRLLEGGNEVLCLDNLFSGTKRNLEGLLDFPLFEFIRHDITRPILVEVDQIYNLACPASPIHYQYNPVKTVKTSILGTLNCLGIAKRVQARILHASTSEVYGDPLEHPQKETYWGHVNPIGPRGCYAEGKRCAETLMMDYHRQNRVSIRIARIFNTYGPKMRVGDGRVVSNFVVNALRGRPLPVYGDGSQTRSFCYVDDLIEGLYKLMNQEEFNGPVNLGSSQEISILELAETILDLVGSSAGLRYAALPEDDSARRQPDTELARKRLSWAPMTDLKTGLGRTIGYFDKRLAAGSKQDNEDIEGA